jgi:hypothetical protein
VETPFINFFIQTPISNEIVSLYKNISITYSAFFIDSPVHHQPRATAFTFHQYAMDRDPWERGLPPANADKMSAFPGAKYWVKKVNAVALRVT